MQNAKSCVRRDPVFVVRRAMMCYVAACDLLSQNYFYVRCTYVMFRCCTQHPQNSAAAAPPAGGGVPSQRQRHARTMVLLATPDLDVESLLEQKPFGFLFFVFVAYVLGVGSPFRLTLCIYVPFNAFHCKNRTSLHLPTNQQTTLASTGTKQYCITVVAYPSCWFVCPEPLIGSDPEHLKLFNTLFV